MLGIFRDRQRARGTREKIQIVDVVAGTGNHGVIAAVDQDRIAVPGFQSPFARMFARIQMLEGKPPAGIR